MKDRVVGSLLIPEVPGPDDSTIYYHVYCIFSALSAFSMILPMYILLIRYMNDVSIYV